MKPDKIYLNTPKVYANSSDSYECSTWATKEYDNCENTEYIRKDALLEWAKKELEMRRNMRRNTGYDYFYPALVVLNDLIEKLNSL